MLQRKPGQQQPRLITLGFLVAVEAEENGTATKEDIELKLAESLSWVEDIGRVEVECLGRVDIDPEDSIAKEKE